MIAAHDRMHGSRERYTRLKFAIKTWFGLILGLSTACTNDGLAPPTQDLSSIYWELRVNYPAVLLSTAAPYNTVQLATVPYGADGHTLPLDSSHGIVHVPVWTSSDSSKVHVSANGMLTALAESDSVRISVRQTIGQITRSDSVVVRVKYVANPPVLSTFSIVPTDSLKRAYLNLFAYVFPITALNENGEPIPEFPVRWRSSDPKVAKLSPFDMGWYLSTFAAPVTISATTWVYGVAKSDSFALEIGWPIYSFVLKSTEVRQTLTASGGVEFAASIRTVDLGPGAMISFVNNTGYGPLSSGVPALPGKAIDIIFDDPTVALSSGGWPGDTSGIGGNIIGIPSDTTLGFDERQKWRRFQATGEHFYTIQPFGVRGSIRVHDK